MANSVKPANPYDNDMNLVATWLKVDRTRWISGVLSGLVAGLFAMIFAMILCKVGGRDAWYPAKLMASILIGPEATVIGHHFGTILLGFVFFEVFAVVFGVIFAHFTATNNMQALLGMGLAWSAFSWIFLWNLYFQSWSTVFASALSSGAVFFVCLVYGLSLTSVAFFDRLLRGTSR